MTLIIPPLIFKQINRMPQADRDRILQALRQVAANPSARPGFTTEMIGQPGVWRLRKGDWRAVFILEGEDIVVLRIGNRRDIYR